MCSCTCTRFSRSSQVTALFFKEHTLSDIIRPSNCYKRILGFNRKAERVVTQEEANSDANASENNPGKGIKYIKLDCEIDL